MIYIFLIYKVKKNVSKIAIDSKQEEKTKMRNLHIQSCKKDITIA